MEALVAMRAMLTDLERAFGLSGAINQLIQALRSGELTGIWAIIYLTKHPGWPHRGSNAGASNDFSYRSDLLKRRQGP